MSDREQLVKEAEDMIRFHESYSLPDRYESSMSYLKHKAAAKTIRRLLSLLPKEGEVVVPAEPTEEMLAAIPKTTVVKGFITKCYRAMLEARPK